MKILAKMRKVKGKEYFWFSPFNENLLKILSSVEKCENYLISQTNVT